MKELLMMKFFWIVLVIFSLNTVATANVVTDLLKRGLTIGSGSLEEEDIVTFRGQIKLTIRYNETNYKFDLLLSDSNQENKVIGTLDRLQSLTQFSSQTAGLRNISRIEIKKNGTSQPATSWFVLQTDKELVYVHKNQTGLFVFKIPNHNKKIIDVSNSFIQYIKTDKSTSFYVMLSVSDISGQKVTYLIDRHTGEYRTIDSKYFSLDGQITIRNPETKFQLEGKEYDIEQLLEKQGLKTIHVGGSNTKNGFDHLADTVSPSTSQGIKQSSIPTNETSMIAAENEQTKVEPPKMEVNFTIKHKNEEYQIYSQSKGRNKGIYVRRMSDEVIVKISTLPHLPAVEGADHGFIIEDDILSHPNLLREIDLLKTNTMDAFEIESTFKPMMTSGNEKHPEENKNAVEFLLKNFKDYKKITSKLLPPPENRNPLMEGIVSQLLSGETTTQILVGDPTDKSLILAEAARQLSLRGPRTWKTISLDTAGFDDIGTVGVLNENATKLSAAIRTIPIVFFSPNFTSLAGYGVTKGSDTDLLDLLSEDFTDQEGYFKLAGAAASKEILQNRIKNLNVSSSLNITNIEDLNSKQLKEYLKRFLIKNYPKITISEENLNYLLNVAKSIRPVNAEPSRSEDFIKGIARKILDDPQTKSQLKEDRSKTIEISKNEIERAITYHYSISESLATEAGQVKLVKNFSTEVGKRVAGHTHILNKVKRDIQIGLAKLHPENEAMSAHWIEGPPGVGKTEMAKAIAATLGVPLEEINMNKYTDASGAKPDQILAKMAKALNKNPYSVILLDEIEKAGFDILQGIFTALSSNTFNFLDESGNGQPIEGKQSLYLSNVILTSNGIGDQVLKWLNKKIEEDPAYDNMTSEQLAEEFHKLYSIDDIYEFLSEGTPKFPKGIPSPLLDRVQIHVAFPPSYDYLVELYKIKLRSIKERTKNNMGLEITLGSKDSTEDAVIRFMARTARNKKMKVRASLRAFEKAITATTAEIRNEDPNYRQKKYFIIDPLNESFTSASNMCSRIYLFKR